MFNTIKNSWARFAKISIFEIIFYSKPKVYLLKEFILWWESFANLLVWLTSISKQLFLSIINITDKGLNIGLFYEKCFEIKFEINLFYTIFVFMLVPCFLIFFRLLIWRLLWKAKCAIGWPLATKFTRLATAVKRKNWSTLFSANGNLLPIIGSTIIFYWLLDISSLSTNGMLFSTQSFSKDLGKWKVTW